VLPIVIAGGSIQPDGEEVRDLNIGFTSYSREPALRKVVESVTRQHQGETPLRVVYTAHDGTCAFVKNMVGGDLTNMAKGKNTEAHIMSGLLVAHSAPLVVPGVESTIALVSPASDSSSSLRIRELRHTDFIGFPRVNKLVGR